MTSATARYVFDGFVFDPATGELHRRLEAGEVGDGEVEVRLPPKPARMLALLLERPGELIGREDLVEALWPGQHLDVDQALAYTVRQVRAALGDDAGQPRYVETLPRRGYRFVGRPRAEELGGPQRPLPFRVPETSAASPGTATRRTRHGLRSGAFVVMAIVGLIGFYAWYWLGAQAELEAPLRIALLPLAPPPDSADGGARMANDRLTEVLLVALAGRPELELVGPATTSRLRATSRPHPEVGRELGVAFVVSGGFRPGRAPDPVPHAGQAEGVLFLQLVRTSDGGHIFAERFRGTEAEIALRMPEVAEAVAEATERN